MALHRDHKATIEYHLKQIKLAKNHYKALIKRHNKAVQKQRSRLARGADKVSASTIRRWARLDRYES